MARKRRAADDDGTGTPVVRPEASVEGQPERCRVLLRFRPLPDGPGADSPFALGADGQSVSVRPRDAGAADDAQFHYDKIFPGTATQEEVFTCVMNDSVDAVLTGFNATVLAYGQSGAGKTFTMFGDDDGRLGIIPRALAEMFQRIAADTGGGVFVVKASMLEIYMEEMRDLLRPSSQKLRLRESAFEGIWVEGLHHIYVPNAMAAVELLRQGIAAWTVGCTNTFSLSLTLTHSLLLSLSLSLSLALSLSLSLSPSLTHTGTHTHTHTHLEQCGHVISEQAVRKLSRAGARFKCPYCPLEVSLAGSLALTF